MTIASFALAAVLASSTAFVVAAPVEMTKTEMANIVAGGKYKYQSDVGNSGQTIWCTNGANSVCEKRK
jgi:hypothetical protein